MTSADLIAALSLPDGALVDRRVPKTLLMENGAPTAADKRRTREGIAEIRWLAALKPTTVGLSEYRDAAREVLEIAVLQLSLHPGARADRLTELVHRAVPYPVLLITRQGHATQLSLAHKRWSLGEAGKTVLDGDVVSVRLPDTGTEEATLAFFRALRMDRQPRVSLYALYQSWVEAVQALCAARITGVFSLPSSVSEAAGRAAAIESYRRLDKRIAKLQAAARKEKQHSRRVEINLELERLRCDCRAACENIRTGGA